jgi:flagellar biosynthesis/type III secretory pathway M-ring protein FliF/YscJ
MNPIDPQTQFLNQGILGALAVVLAGVIVFLFLRSERERARLEAKHDGEVARLQALRDAEHTARLEDQKANQVVLLEVHDRAHEQNQKRDEVLEKVLERFDRSLPRR